MTPDNEQLQTFRAIRGAPATVLLLLFIRGVSMTNREICRFTGYSDKTVTAANGLLESIGFLQYNGRQHGWSLRAGVQLPLPLGESYPQVEASYPQAVDKEIGNSPIYPQQIGNSPIYAPTTTTTIYTPPLSELSSSSSSKNGHLDRRISDLGQNGHTDRKNSDLAPAPTGAAVTYWLRRAGVGANSPKYRQLAAAGLDPHTVRAHALERLACPDTIPVGLFIRKLEDGDPPPAPRCPDCYRQLDDYGNCNNYFCEPSSEEE